MEFTMTLEESELTEFVEGVIDTNVNDNFQSNVEEALDQVDLVDKVRNSDSFAYLAEDVSEHLGDVTDTIDWYSVIHDNSIVTDDQLPDMDDYVSESNFEEFATQFVVAQLGSFNPEGVLCEMGELFQNAVRAAVRPMIQELVEEQFRDVFQRVGQALNLAEVGGDRESEQAATVPAEAASVTWEYAYNGIGDTPHTAVKKVDGVVMDVRYFNSEVGAQAYVNAQRAAG